MSLHPRTYLIMVAGRPAAHLERHGREEEAGQKLVSKGRKLAADCLDNWPDWHTLAILCVERSTRKSLKTICWLSTLAARAPSICSPSNISTATCHRSRDEKHLGAGRAKVGRNPRGIHLPLPPRCLPSSTCKSARDAAGYHGAARGSCCATALRPADQPAAARGRRPRTPRPRRRERTAAAS